MSIKTNANYTTKAGYSVIELMVTISIVVLVTGIALGRYSSFNSSVLLKSQAYDVALDIRQAQAYGVSTSVQTGDERSPFGIHFARNDNQAYVLFQDTANPLDRYNNNDTMVGAKYLLDSRFEIKNICVGDSSTCTDVNNASVLFRRPNFNALIWGNGVGYNNYRIEVVIGIEGNPNGYTNKVIVESSGLIMVE